MNAHACQQMNLPVVYLSPHYITQYNILGPEVPEDHPELEGLILLPRIRKMVEIRARQAEPAVNYIYNCMKKIKGDGCVLAPHRIG
jgi:hypothetical protein